MIDGVKLRIKQPGYAQRLRNNPRFSFYGEFNEQDGDYLDQVLNARPTERKLGTKICPDGTVELRGSLHVFANNGLHNYDDFTRSRLLATVEEVADLWKFDPRQAQVHSLEFGVNFRTEGTADAFLHSLVTHGCRPLTTMGRRAFYGVQDEHFDYRFKCYDKGTQYREYEVGDNLLRAETHVERMRYLHPVAPALTLYDLTSRRTLARLATIAEEQFARLLAVPLIMPNGLSLPERKAWEAGSNPRTWEELPAVQARRRRDYLRETLARYNADPMPAARAAHRDKWQELLRV